MFDNNDNQRHQCYPVCFNDINPNNSSDLLAVLASRGPDSTEKPTTAVYSVTKRFHASRAFGKLSSKEKDVWALFITIIFSKPENEGGVVWKINVRCVEFGCVTRAH